MGGVGEGNLVGETHEQIARNTPTSSSNERIDGGRLSTRRASQLDENRDDQ